ncbi:MAG TPA: hypothetical protein VFE16_11265 [Candidatus Cybelea sp.]|jgi:hypothetical protein|nr:hypothetical protein [Candidatus Cybelea sp.]
MRAWSLLAMVLLVPVPAAASCSAGGVPSYRDITYVNVRLSSLVGILHPVFAYEGKIAFPHGSRPAFAEDAVTAIRCGVTTTLGTASAGGTSNLEDAQGKAFLRLEDELRKAIFAEKWIAPTPAPT